MKSKKASGRSLVNKIFLFSGRTAGFYQYKYKSKDNDIGEFMNSDYYKLPIYLYETENLLYFSAAGPQAEKCNYLYFKDKLEGINWTDSNDEPVISLIASDASYLYFMYNGI